MSEKNMEEETKTQSDAETKAPDSSVLQAQPKIKRKRKTNKKKRGMWKQNQFERELDKLFKERTYWLKKAIGIKKIGQPPTFNQAKVRKTIKKLQEIASEILINKFKKSEFRGSKKREWWVKGHGVEGKKENFKKWFKKNKLPSHYIYIFWAGRKPIYAGRATHGEGEAASKFDKHYFSQIQHIDIYPSKASELPKLECLAIHIFDPSKNKIKAGAKKWTKKCPICEVRREIESELKRLFILKKFKPKKRRKAR